MEFFTFLARLALILGVVATSQLNSLQSSLNTSSRVQTATATISIFITKTLPSISFTDALNSNVSSALEQSGMVSSASSALSTESLGEFSALNFTAPMIIVSSTTGRLPGGTVPVLPVTPALSFLPTATSTSPTSSFTTSCTLTTTTRPPEPSIAYCFDTLMLTTTPCGLSTTIISQLGSAGAGNLHAHRVPLEILIAVVLCSASGASGFL